MHAIFLGKNIEEEKRFFFFGGGGGYIFWSTSYHASMSQSCMGDGTISFRTRRLQINLLLFDLYMFSRKNQTN